MQQPKLEIGTKKTLVLYRIQIVKEDFKPARILLVADEYNGANS